MAKTLPAATAEVKKLIDGGDLLLAFDRASSHLERFPDDETLKHQALLALVRAGATERAARLFREWGLDRSTDGHVLALEARIAKDRALKLAGAERPAALREAAESYRRIYERKPDYYQGINWASLAFLAGDRDEAHRVAEMVLADPAVAEAADYWAAATRAEANIVLGRLADARADLAAAAGKPGADAGARSSTRRQLRLLLAASGEGLRETAEFLAPLAPGPALHAIDLAGAGQGFHDYSGGAVRTARERIRTALAELRPSAVFSSLGSAAEILFAEEALASGTELNVVLAFPTEAFLKAFIPTSGGWVRRFKTCCNRAHSLVFATDEASSDDAGLESYAARVAMGLTLLRAQHLDSDAVQVILEAPSGGEALDPDRNWHTGGERRQVRLKLTDAAAPHAEASLRKPRRCCAVVFGDLPGFSRLPERFLPIFWDTVMRAIGDVVSETGDDVVLKNTWGDAIHLVIPDVRRAAHVCLAVQRRLATIDGRALGRDDAPTMRIGAHFGPVFEGWDPVVAQHTYYGRALSRAARIEPITPPGTVYVTEAFAAILLLESRGEFTCTYVGQVPLAKGYGTFRMYDLKAETPVERSAEAEAQA